MQKLLPPTVITICSNRKRAPIPDGLHAATLPAGAPDEVAAAWAERLQQAPAVSAAREVYCGRAFREAEMAAAACEAELHVISAGLGLISADTPIPAYGLTLSASQADGVLRKTTDGAAAWWSALTGASPYHEALRGKGGLILAALPAPYLAMVAAEWSRWPELQLHRLRLFCKERPQGVAEKLAACWMPYDSRLEVAGPGYAGTQTDFAQRALRHFVEQIGVSEKTAAEHATLIKGALTGLSAPQKPDRTRLDDPAVTALIHEHWEAVGGRSGHMLRRLRRELGVACEQGRFKTLFHSVAAARAGAAQ